MKEILALDVKLTRSDFHLQVQCHFDHLITGIFGVSGAGKTTLMQLIAGLEQPESGVIRLFDRTLVNTFKNQSLAPEKRKVGLVFQEGRLFPHLNVEENLRYGLKYRRNNVQKVNFEELVSLLNIRDILTQSTKNISGGQRQRVALGRTLMTEPDLLLLDEPFAGLDNLLRLQIIPYLRRIAARFEVPMLVVSHDLPDLLRLTNHLMIVHNGICLGIGSPFELIGIPDAYKLMNTSGVINCFDLKVDTIDDTGDIIMLTCSDCPVIKAECSAEVNDLETAQSVQATLRPEDITLALHRIDDISIQNQVSGTILKVQQIDRKVYCIIDIGITIMAEITTASARKLRLQEGKQIWCLFKAAALKINQMN